MKKQVQTIIYFILSLPLREVEHKLVLFYVPLLFI